MATSIALSVHVNATPDTVFAVLTESARLTSFWTSDSLAEPLVRSLSQFGFPNGSRLEVRVDALEPNRHVAWMLLNDLRKGPHWVGTIVTWDLHITEIGSTEILFQQTNWPSETVQTEVAKVTYAWAQVLRALKGYVETATPQPIFTAALTR